MTKGHTTRQRIIAAAAPLFNQRGFAGASMQDIMAATGLEKGGLYRHFSSKEELAAEAFRFSVSQSVKTRTGDLDHIQGSIPKLRYLVDRFVTTPSVIEGGCPILNTAVDADDGNPALRALVCDSIRDWKTRLTAILESGLANAEIRPKTNPGRIANAIVSTLEGALMISRLEGTRQALEDARTTLLSILDAITA